MNAKINVAIANTKVPAITTPSAVRCCRSRGIKIAPTIAPNPKQPSSKPYPPAPCRKSCCATKGSKANKALVQL
ncbi:MAG: hypothetical protein V7K85_24805 [Nostoc sp.]